MRRILLLSFCLALCACSHSSYTGQVSEVRQLRGGIVVDLDGAYPNQGMTIYIPKRYEGDVIIPSEGQRITVTGAQKNYRGRPEIEVTSNDQIK